MTSNKRSYQEIFEHVLRVVQSDRFQRMEGLGNEVPFFICPFAPQLASQVNRQMVQQLTNQLERVGITVLDVNLYDLSLTLLKERGIFQQILEIEPTRTKSELLDLLRNVLDPETHLIPTIGARMEAFGSFDVLFLSGVGAVFPYIRSHTVLNNLQLIAKDRPTVMFFPGDYKHSPEAGASLDLFDRLQDDKYYRAFNIFQYEV